MYKLIIKFKIWDHKEHTYMYGELYRTYDSLEGLDQKAIFEKIASYLPDNTEDEEIGVEIYR